MVWEIAYSNQARKALKRAPANVSALIQAKLVLLANDPYAPNNNVKRLQGRTAYRLRVGDWRAIYELQGAVLTIYVVTVAPRGGAYS